MLVALSVGLGLLVERAAGRRIPGALLPATGLAGIIAAGGLVTCYSGLAQFTTATVAALAVAGYASICLPGRGGRSIRSFSIGSIPPWPVLGAIGVFLVFGAPVILSGDATFAGYIKLDDTSTWLAFTDHVLAAGHSTAGLAPSSYEATVQINLSAGYPLGAFIPLGVGHELTGADSAWLFQPYMAAMAAMMSLVFFELLRPVVPRNGIRAALVFIAAQPALLVGFAYWGGVKEVATALLVAILAATVTGLARPGRTYSLRALTPAPIVAGAALIGVMGAGGAPWLLAIALAAVVLMVVGLVRAGRRGAATTPDADAVERAPGDRERPDAGPGLFRIYLVRALVVVGGVALIGLPTVLASGSFFSPSQSGLTSGEEMGNLIQALSLAQYAGPWPVGDFRLRPESGLLTAILVGAALIAWGFGVLAALRNRAWALLVLGFGTGLGSLIVWIAGSPWIEGKALATGTASFLILAMAGIGWLLTGAIGQDGPGSESGGDRSGGRGDSEPGRARPGGPVAPGPGPFRALGVALLIVPLAVLVSNALAFNETWLAPRGQLAELGEIGKEFAGQGPTLMTEYQPYGVRHFLRRTDAEGASELRRRLIPRRNGEETEKGEWSDTDQLALSPDREGLFTYRTLVLRRNPRQSRPPSPYQLVSRGDYYDVWQRPEGFEPTGVVEHLGLGSDLDPAAVPSCTAIGRLAARAGPGGTVIAVPRQPNAVSTLDSFPDDWISDPSAGTLTPLSDGTASGLIEVPAAGEYDVYVGGSARGEVSVEIGGISAGLARNRLNNNAQFIELGQLGLEPGIKQVSLTYQSGGVLRHGSGAYPFALGPVVLSPSPPEEELIELDPGRATELCGQRLDWVEAVR